MSNHFYEQARRDAVLGAEPLELTVLLYEAATDSIRTARRCLAGGDIAGRTRAVNRAMEIVLELSAALDRGQDPALANRLTGLYGYVFDRLREGNFRQEDDPLAEAFKVLDVLREAWSACRRSDSQSARSGAEISCCA